MNERDLIKKIYMIYKKDDYLEAEDLERKLKAQRDEMIDQINEDYARFLVPLKNLVIHMETGDIEPLQKFLLDFGMIMSEEIERGMKALGIETEEPAAQSPQPGNGDEEYERCERCGTYVHRESMYAGICAECQAEDEKNSKSAGLTCIEEILKEVLPDDSI